ncbi:hypothetical protein GCM10027168_05240 [Streptomyces capparidis]
MTAPPVRGVAAAPAPVMRAGSALYRVCFVCTANICRSPMAASVFRSRVAAAGLADRIKVNSGGTGGWFEGEGADLRTVAVLAEHGYPDDHSARQFKVEWFVGLDLVVALDEGHARFLRHLAPTPRDVEKVRLLRTFDPAASGPHLDVPDPYFGGMDQFRLCLELIEAASDGLLEAIRAHVAPADGGRNGAGSGSRTSGPGGPGVGGGGGKDGDGPGRNGDGDGRRNGGDAGSGESGGNGEGSANGESGKDSKNDVKDGKSGKSGKSDGRNSRSAKGREDGRGAEGGRGGRLGRVGGRGRHARGGGRRGAAPGSCQGA